jgi:1-acyl-sn-glycerol-3-phosphate acyltransferase
MKLLSKYILEILGWEIKGKFPDIKKSVIIFAPHTSYWDGFYGKLYFMQSDINYKFLSKKEFFKFPVKYFFKAFGSIPVQENSEFIKEMVLLLNNNENIHIIISPEGQLAKTDHWKRGFYYIAKKAKVPIIVGYIDYRKKELGVKSIINETNNLQTTMTEIKKMYENVNAKYPENFTTDIRFN